MCIATLDSYQLANCLSQKPRRRRRSTASNQAAQQLYPSRKTAVGAKPKTQIQKDKELYHKLQNLHQHPECLPEARTRLIDLFDHTLHEALNLKDQSGTILSVPEYDPQALHDFLARSADKTADVFAAYTARRKAGGPREMFPTLEYAKYWARLAAPVKYVDGSWLGGVHRVESTKPSHRAASRIAWQILSEELGDGDLGKNHVWVYEQLVNSIGAGSIGLGHETKFISNVTNSNHETRVWSAAIAQLCVSLFPAEMLPEILGFNMAYESLPCHLLITIQEFKELKLDPYYFVLHVSIDNGHSGHAAMGAAAVIAYMDSLPAEEREEAWRRVQAGYILAEGLPTTPAPISQLDKEVTEIFRQKCETAKPMHSFCPGAIGGSQFGKKLEDWLDPEQFERWGMLFTKVLADSRWVVKGHPEESKLIQELQWGGRMFGAYTTEETMVLSRWIEGLAPASTNPTFDAIGSYTRFTNNTAQDIIIPEASTYHLPTHIPRPTVSKPTTLSDLIRPLHIGSGLTTQQLATLLLASATPLEHFPSYPSHISTPAGMACLSALRAIYGFMDPNSPDLCAGMDEVHRLFVPNSPPIGIAELGHAVVATTPRRGVAPMYIAGMSTGKPTASPPAAEGGELTPPASPTASVTVDSGEVSDGEGERLPQSIETPPASRVKTSSPATTYLAKLSLAPTGENIPKIIGAQLAMCAAVWRNQAVVEALPRRSREEGEKLLIEAAKQVEGAFGPVVERGEVEFAKVVEGWGVGVAAVSEMVGLVGEEEAGVDEEGEKKVASRPEMGGRHITWRESRSAVV